MPTIFITPGLIPLDAFTQFAVHAKPNSDNPIGHFGTGLKYAVAIILRHHGSFKMWVGGTEYQFYTHKTEFRGTDITNIRMRKRHGPLAKWRSTKLPFTVDLGKNWGLWQAYRELLSNTLDEGGDVIKGEVSGDTYAKKGTTVIEIDCRGFPEAQKDVWLPHALTEEGKNPETPDIVASGVKVWRRPSKYLYYKGIRVHELPIPSYFTYDFTSGITLSEDRSIMNQYSALSTIAETLDTLDFEILKGLFEDKENRWFEAHELSFFGLTQTRGSMRLVAEAYGSGGGYYLRSFVSALEEHNKKENHNFDVYLTSAEVHEFVMSWQNGDVEDTELVSLFKNWLLSEATDALEYVRETAEEHGEQLPLDLEK